MTAKLGGMSAGAWRFCVAPMMGGTDRHCRYFHRLLTNSARLYTEMVVADAILRGDRGRLLAFDETERPVALQLGGGDPGALAQAAGIGAEAGYDEINLNVGCPSDRVRSGTFGACLMKEPRRVADSVAAMREAVDIPVTVKCRIGVDDQPAESFFGFVETVAAAGCAIFIVHARKAWLGGVSPKENRELPPLNYDIVRRLKRARPDLIVVVNGGIASISQARGLEDFDGVMLGRAAYEQPAMLAEVDNSFFGAGEGRRIEETAREMSRYVGREAARGVPPNRIVRHMLGLFRGRPGARLWRRLLSEQGSATPPDIIDRALAAIGY